MKKKLTKKELLEKLDVFRKKIKYYIDTLGKGMEELGTIHNGITPDQITKTTSHLRQSLRKIWGILEPYYINLGIKVTFSEETPQQKIDIFYHSFSENFFHDNSIIQTLNHALQLTDIAIGKCEVLSEREIARLGKNSFTKNFSLVQFMFYFGFMIAGFLLDHYLTFEKSLNILKSITKILKH